MEWQVESWTILWNFGQSPARDWKWAYSTSNSTYFYIISHVYSTQNAWSFGESPARDSRPKIDLYHVLFDIIPHNSTWAQIWTPDLRGDSGIGQDPDEAEKDLSESNLPLKESTSQGSVISCVHTLFSHGADSVDFPAFARALSRLPASQTDMCHQCLFSCLKLWPVVWFPSSFIMTIQIQNVYSCN